MLYFAHIKIIKIKWTVFSVSQWDLHRRIRCHICHGGSRSWKQKVALNLFVRSIRLWFMCAN